MYVSFLLSLLSFHNSLFEYGSIVAYYNEGIDTVSNTIREVVKRLPLFTRHRVVVYAKNGEKSEEAVEALLSVADEVVWLPNIGREGETYLVCSLQMEIG